MTRRQLPFCDQFLDSGCQIEEPDVVADDTAIFAEAFEFLQHLWHFGKKGAIACIEPDRGILFTGLAQVFGELRERKNKS